MRGSNAVRGGIGELMGELLGMRIFFKWRGVRMVFVGSNQSLV